jgi:fatty acid desaturase
VPDHKPLARDQLRSLRRLSRLRGLGSIAWTWAWIAACFVAYALVPHPLVIAAGVVVVSGRQLALAVLMHEGAHRLLLPDRAANDRVSDWLCAYPLLLDTRSYRAIHLQHHKHTWTDDDPDLGLATPFPITPASFRRKVIRDLAGITGIKRTAFLLATWRFRKAPFWGFVIANAAILLASWAAGIWEAYLLLWWLPSLTGFSLVLRLRSIAEHAAVADPTDPLKQTRTTLAGPLVRFLMAPHHVGYHLEHHLYMYVPHYRLARVHALLGEAGVLDHAEVARDYRGVWRRATRPAYHGVGLKPRRDH